jgi:hypothetical protein
VWLADRRVHDGVELLASTRGDADVPHRTQGGGEPPAGARDGGEPRAGAHGGREPSAGTRPRVGDQSVDPADATAALGAELSRAAATVEAPLALAIPFARSEALDRVLGWHDAIVVVRPRDATVALLQLVLESVAALDRPVVAVAPPRHLAAAAATAGLHVPAFATAAVAQLGADGLR